MLAYRYKRGNDDNYDYCKNTHANVTKLHRAVTSDNASYTITRARLSLEVGAAFPRLSRVLQTTTTLQRNARIIFRYFIFRMLAGLPVPCKWLLYSSSSSSYLRPLDVVTLLIVPRCLRAWVCEWY